MMKLETTDSHAEDKFQKKIRTGRSTFMMVAGIFEQLCKSERILILGPEICLPQASVTTQIRHAGKLEDPTGVEEFIYDSVNV